MVEDMKGKIRVYARCRPLSTSEKDRVCGIEFHISTAFVLLSFLLRIFVSPLKRNYWIFMWSLSDIISIVYFFDTHLIYFIW